MLRKIEKGINTQKKTSARTDDVLSGSNGDARSSPGEPGYRSPADGFTRASSSSLFASNELPPLPRAPASDAARAGMDVDDDEDDDARASNDVIFPAKLIRREQNQRHSFFSTILNPDSQPPAGAPGMQHHYERGAALSSKPAPAAAAALQDPVEAGLLPLSIAKQIFDAIFIRLNPFINLFDPALHTFEYVQQRSPFLLTVLLMCSAKFFKPEFYPQCKKTATEMAVQAFAEGWKSIEVVQAFACMTYWKEPDDNRTWTYIGYVRGILICVFPGTSLIRWGPAGMPHGGRARPEPIRARAPGGRDGASAARAAQPRTDVPRPLRARPLAEHADGPELDAPRLRPGLARGELARGRRVADPAGGRRRRRVRAAPADRRERDRVVLGQQARRGLGDLAHGHAVRHDAPDDEQQHVPVDGHVVARDAQRFVEFESR